MDVNDKDKTSTVSEETSEAKAAPEANLTDESGGYKFETTKPEKEGEEKVEVVSKDPEPTPKQEEVAPTKEVEPVQAIAPKSITAKEKESELTTLSGLLLVGLAAAMLYVGTVVFAKDSLIFFAGIFVYMLVAPPGTYAQGKSKMASFTKELALAFAVTLVLFGILKSALPPDADQAELFTIVLAVLGIKLVHYPYYNTKKAEEED